jgi:hypothetical protein
VDEEGFSDAGRFWVRRLIAVVAVIALFPLPVAGAERGREGCQAHNPLAPRCSYTVTHTSRTPITGAAGIGNWVVRVHRDGRRLVYRSLPDGRPTVLEIRFKVDDVVVARALTPGSFVTVGHED